MNSKFTFLIMLFLFIQATVASDSVSGNDTILIQKGAYYSNQLMYDSAEYYYSMAIRTINPKLNPELYCNVSNQYAASLFWQDKLTETEPVCWENLKRCNELLGPLHPETAMAHINLGAFKFVAGGYGVITEHFLCAAHIFEHNFGDEHPMVAKAYEWLGTTHEKKCDTLEAKKYLWKSYGIWKKAKGSDHPDLAEIYRYMGLYLKRFSKHDSALICFYKAKELFDSKYGPINFQSVKCLNNMADIYAERDQAKLVDSIYNHCLYLIENFKSPNRFAQIMTLYNIGEDYREKGNYQQALKYVHKILPLYFQDFNNEDVLSNPENVTELPYYVVYLTILFKANTLLNWYHSDTLHQKDYNLAVYRCYELIDQVLTEIRKRITNLDKSLEYTSAISSLYYAFAYNAMETFLKTNDTTFVSKALTYIGKNSHLGKPQVSDIDLMLTYGIPQTAITKRNELKNEINLLENELLTSKSSILKDSLQQCLNLKMIELEVYHYNISQTYPGITSTTKPDREIYMEQILKKLGSNTTLLIFTEKCFDYESAPDEITVIGISEDGIKTHNIDGRNAWQKINELYKNISDNAANKNIETLTKDLYQLFIDPFNGMLKKNIIIIPSQHVSLIPFDILPDLSKQEAKLMIETHTIWKEFSIHTFLNENDRKKTPAKLLAVAPSFNNKQTQQLAILTKRDTSMINLAGAIRECENISKIYSSKLLTGFSATEENFKKLCPAYSIIHLSTHGIPFEDDEDMIQLAFSDTDNDYKGGFLNFYEILNLQLRADLIVLSACKTGIGKMNKSEGIVNLAWAFKKSGANSAVTSLWDANDYASSQIMIKFYKYLHTGFSKPEALRKAKLDYLKSNDKLMSTPYFWAGFEYWGNETGISPDRNSWNIYLTIAFLFSFIIVLVLSVYWHLHRA